MIWTNEKTKFLIENYPHFGSLYCSKKLGFLQKQIRSKAIKLKLKITKEGRKYTHTQRLHPLKNPNNLKVDPRQFIQPSTPEICYLMGFLWADGFLGSNYTINTEIISTDANQLKKIFQSSGNWGEYHRQRKNWKSTTKFSCSSKLLYDHFKSIKFDQKSKGISPCKMISLIPDNMKHYWFRGYIDGDGCFYQNIKQHLNQFIISSCYEQDWIFMESLAKELNIKKFKISTQSKKSSYSQFRCTNKSDINLLGKYIYQGKNFGLDRKKEKFLLISTDK